MQFFKKLFFIPDIFQHFIDSLKASTMKYQNIILGKQSNTLE